MLQMQTVNDELVMFYTDVFSHLNVAQLTVNK